MNINLVSPRALPLNAALLTASLTIPLALSGCGGGGNSGPATAVPTAIPVATSTPTPGSNPAYDKNRFTPNYVSALEAEKVGELGDPAALLRWRVFPLSVYFKPNRFYSKARQELTVEGFDRWVTATGADGVTYRVTDNADNADITVNFTNFTGGAGDTLGYTRSSYDAQSRYVVRGPAQINDEPQGVRRVIGTQIEIGITGDRNNDLVTAAHELGHALGINDHSPNRPDLMFKEGNDQFTGGITTQDLNTLLTSYNGVFNKNPNARTAPSNGEIMQSLIHEKAGEHDAKK